MPEKPENNLIAPKCRGGAPQGNRNAWKHGRFTAEAKAHRRQIRALLRAARRLMAEACH
jgi:uncharacterized protein YjcR